MTSPVTAIPPLREVPSNLERDLAEFLADMKERLEVWGGIRGDILDQKMSLRQLVESGIVEFRDGQNRVFYDPNNNSLPFQGTFVREYTEPPAVEDFTITGGFNTIFVTWAPIDQASFPLYAYTEIWREPRAPVSDPDDPDFVNAVLITRTSAPIFADVIESPTQKSYWYWARHVSVYDVYGPLTTGNNSAPFTDYGTTSYDPAYVHEVLTSSLDESQFTSALLTRLNGIESNAGALSALQTSVTNLQGTIADLTSGVSDVYVQATAPVPGVGGIPDPIPDYSRWYDSDDDNAPYYWDGSAWQSLEDPRIGANESAITALEASVSSAEGNISANADAISTLDATVVALDGTVVGIASSVTNLTVNITNLQLEDGSVWELENGDDLELQGPSDVATAGAEANKTLEARVVATEEGIVSNATEITELTANLSTTDSTLSGVSSALGLLDARVEDNEDGLSSQSAAISALESTVNDGMTGVAATASALGALTTTVNVTQAGLITANSNAIDALELTVNDPTTGVEANTTAIGTLETTVNVTQAGLITANANAIDALETTVNDPTDGVVATANAVDTLETTVNVTQAGQISANAQSVTNLGVSLTRRGKDLFVEDFSDNDVSRFESDWGEIHVVDQGPYSIVVGSSPAGPYVLQAGDNAGETDYCYRALNRELAMPIVENEIYEISMWARRTAGTGKIYIGVHGFKGDVVSGAGALVRAGDGTDNWGGHWFAANQADATSSWVRYSGYFTRTGGSIFISPGNHTINNPGVIHADAEYACPAFVFNYGGIGTHQLAGVRLRRVQLDVDWDGVQGSGKPADGADVTAAAFALMDATTTKNNGLINAHATAINQLEVTIGDDSAMVGTIMDVLGRNDGSGMRAQYMVKTDVNGKVAGFGTYNDGETSEFVVAADTFAVAKQSIESGQAFYPFIVGTIDGQSVISLNAATFIADAAITDAKIGTVSADKLFVNFGTIADAIIGTADIKSAMVDDIQSSAWNPTTKAGWKITKAGNIEASSIIIYDASGEVIMNSGGLGGSAVKDVTGSLSNYLPYDYSDFETIPVGASGWFDWSVNGDPPVISDEDARFGTRSVKITNTAGAGLGLYTSGAGAGVNFPLKIPPFRRWIISYWVKSDDDSSQLWKGSIQESDTTFHGGINNTSIPAGNAGAWKQVVIESNLTAVSETSVRLRLWSDDVVANSTVYIDSVMLCDVTAMPNLTYANFPDTHTPGFAQLTNTIDALQLINAPAAAGADVTDYTDTRVANGRVENNMLSIAHPVGASYSNMSEGIDGAIKITLPQSWGNTMLKFEVDVFNNTSQTQFTVAVGGYTELSTPEWRQCFAQIYGNTAANNQVRFGHDGSKCCVVIGTASDVDAWRYMHVRVRNFQAGYSNYSLDQWDDGWSIGMITSDAGITYTATIADALLDAKSILGQGALATKSAVNLASTEVTNKSLANLDASADTKLTGIATGATKNSLLSGTTDPTGGVGSNDDFYHQTTNNSVWQKRAGTWYKIGDVTDYTDTKIANGFVDGNVLTIARPLGGSYVGGAADLDGAIKVTLPTTWTNNLVQFEIEVLQIGADKSFSLVVGGKINSVGSYWDSVFARLYGSVANNNRVRFGHDGSKCCVIVGDVTDVDKWDWPRVTVRNFRSDSGSLATWDDGWSVGLITTTAGITFSSSDISDSLLDARSIIGQKALATKDNVDLASGDVVNKSLANLDGTAATKLTGIAENADVTDYDDFRVSNNIEDGNITTIVRPGGGEMYVDAANVNGAIKVALPVAGTGTMIKFEVDVYNHLGGRSYTMYIAGYIETNNQWYNAAAQIVGNLDSNNDVRFGFDGTKMCVVIGNVAETASYQYPRAVVRNLQASLNNYSVATWKEGWSVGMITTLSGISNITTISDALLDANSFLGKGAFATVEEITSGNIADLMADKVIATTYIADLAVDTLQLADQAVTIPSGAFSDTQVTNSSTTPSELVSLSFTSTGAPVSIEFSLYNYPQSSPVGNWTVQLFWNGSVLQTMGVIGIDHTEYGSRGIVSGTFQYTFGAGSVTLSLRVYRSSGSGSASFNYSSLKAIEVKK